MNVYPTSAHSSAARFPSIPKRISQLGPDLAARLTAAAVLLGTSLPASALDGLQILRCLAAPSWRAIAQCVPTNSQLLRGLAGSKALSSCTMVGSHNAAGQNSAGASGHCLHQFKQVIDGPNSARYDGAYNGAVPATFNGWALARTWRSMDGQKVTDFSSAAKAQLGHWDAQFDGDHVDWLTTQPLPASPTEPGN